MVQQQQKAKPKRNFAIGDDIFFAIKQLASLRGLKHPAPLVTEIFKNYIDMHKEELLPET